MARAASTNGQDEWAEIVAAIEALSPAKRRALQRRLHAQGLFVAEELQSDQNRLMVATAVRDPELPGSPRPRQASMFEAQEPAPSLEVPAAPNKRRRLSRVEPDLAAAQATTPEPKAVETRPSRAAGRVVLGSPETAEETPHAMAPVPGQAPEQTIQVVFDGGSRGNPGEGYGSYQMLWPGMRAQLVRVEFGKHYTNNQAEYDTLIRALEDIHRRLQQLGAAPGSAQVHIFGDSLLVVNQVLGKWKCKDPLLAQRRDQVRSLLQSLGRWQIEWHGRENSVRTLGH